MVLTSKTWNTIKIDSHVHTYTYTYTYVIVNNPWKGLAFVLLALMTMFDPNFSVSSFLGYLIANFFWAEGTCLYRLNCRACTQLTFYSTWYLKLWGKPTLERSKEWKNKVCHFRLVKEVLHKRLTQSVYPLKEDKRQL